MAITISIPRFVLVLEETSTVCGLDIARISSDNAINLKINKMGCNFSISEGTLSKALSVGILSLAFTFPLL